MTTMTWTVRHFMSQPAVTMDCHEVVADAIERMQASGIHHLVVTDGDRPIGILSDRDVLRMQVRKAVALEVVQVGEAMSPEPYQVGPEMGLAQVAGEMAASGVGAALVMEQGQLVGVLTLRDGMRALASTVGARFAAQPGPGAVSAQWRKILCPVDFSDCARGALELATALAVQHQAELTLLHVCPIMEAVLPGAILQPPPAPLERMEKDAAQTLGVWRGRAEALGAANVCTSVHVGVTWRSIVNHAAEEHSDLIVMGTVGRTGLRHLLLGSVAEHVMRHASCAVVTVRPAATP